jgi:fluoride exporter
LKDVLFVAMGGAAGSVCRYLMGSLATATVPGSQVPVATMIVNVVGAFLIGLLAGGTQLPGHWRHVLVIGFLGGFTTFSAFSWDTTNLATSGHPRCALINLALTVSLTLLAALGGMKVKSLV